ncbi:MAG: hypothetical protein JOZ28_03920 [Candidatus Eremiobacteraeota bacterium]|nr:hypothetical protein [Candidatus Eremiobacteraeota bacterium]
MSRYPDGPVLALATLIAAAIANDAVAALVRAPAWLESIAVVVLLSIVVFRLALRHTHLRLRHACVWLTCGLAAGLSIPTAAPPPRGIITHAVGGSARVSAGTDLLAALQAIDDDPAGILGRRMVVHGTWSGERSQPATVSVRIMACCAADAVDAGLDVVPLRRVVLAAGSRVRVAGLVYSQMHDGELRYGLTQATVSAAAPHERP